MIGIVDCRSKDPGQTWAGTQPEMLEFFDRPLLQHAVEQMVQIGVDHCVLITEDTSLVMRRWGTGERWGCTFSAITPQRVVQFLAGLPDAPIMVGRGDCIPCLSKEEFSDAAHHVTLLVFHELLEGNVKQRLFTGWAVTNPCTLLNQCFATFGAEGLLSLGSSTALQVEICICCDTPKAFLRAQETVLNAVEDAVIFHGVQLRAGVWAARNVHVHPSVRIVGKVYLAENVRVAANVTLVGPLVVCRDSAIAANAVLSNACVQPGTYLGKGMALHDDVVMHDAIIRSEQGTVLMLCDAGKLASSQISFIRYLKDVFWGTELTSEVT